MTPPRIDLLSLLEPARRHAGMPSARSKRRRTDLQRHRRRQRLDRRQRRSGRGRASETTVVRLEQNHGFAGGVNAGIRTALERGADAVLLLNNDMVVEQGFLEPLAAALAADGAAAAACSQILYADEPDRCLVRGRTLPPGLGPPRAQHRLGPAAAPAVRRPYRTDCLCGGAVLLSQVALDGLGCSTSRCSPTARISTDRCGARCRAPRARRAGEHRATPRLGLLGRRGVADLGSTTTRATCSPCPSGTMQSVEPARGSAGSRRWRRTPARRSLPAGGSQDYARSIKGGATWRRAAWGSVAAGLAGRRSSATPALAPALCAGRSARAGGTRSRSR